MRFALLISVCFSLLWVLSACGFSPVYGTHTSHQTAAHLAAIEVQGPKGRYNELLAEELRDSLNPEHHLVAPSYRLSVGLGMASHPIITEADGTASRVRMDFVSPYTLVRIVDGKVLQKGKIRRTQSYNISNDSDYSSFISQRDIVQRGMLALANDYQLRLSSYFASVEP